MTDEQWKVLRAWAADAHETVTYGQTKDAAKAALAELAECVCRDEAGAIEAGTMRERRECATIVEEWGACPERSKRRLSAKAFREKYGPGWPSELILSRGPLLPPLPPERLAEDNARLRKVLAELVLPFVDRASAPPMEQLRQTVIEARKLLGEAGQ